MNTLRFIFAALVVSLSLMSCNEQPCIRKDVTYPDLISPIYYVDFIQIDSPRIAFVNSVPYIFSSEKVMLFEDEQDFLRQKGVIRYLTPNLLSHRYINYLNIYDTKKRTKWFDDIVIENKFYFDEMFLPDDSLGNIPVYKFAFEPEGFVLTLISEIDSVIADGDQIYDILFSNDYSLALAPILSKGDLRRINELWYRRLHGRDLDWGRYLKWYERIGLDSFFNFSGTGCRT